VSRYRQLASAAALLAACAMISAACGQKAGVHLASGTGGNALGGAATGDNGLVGGVDNGSGTGAGGAGTGSASGSGAAAGSSGGAGSGSAGSGAAGGGSSGGGTAGSGGSAPGTGAGDTAGVSADTIIIGIHAPASGAGAPATSFYKYKQAYFDSIGATINGRKVVVEFADDGYNPSQAVAACKTLVQDKHVFLLVGGGGVDQIVECAKYAATVGVPYLAEGVTEQGLGRLPNYFAESMTYPAQGKLLAQYIKDVGKKTKWAMIRGNTANFDDAHTAFVNAAGAAGLTKVWDIAVPKDATSDQMQAAAQEFCTAVGNSASNAAQVALYPLIAPSLFINFANFLAGQNCVPQYTGVGITLGLNVVATGVCPNNGFRNGATFFSPFQGLDKADPAYYNAIGHNADADDIAYALWAAEKLLGEELRAGGRNLSRQSFIQGVLQKKIFDVGTYPRADFSTSRFGGTAVHVLRADCSSNGGKGGYVTESLNKSSF